MPIAALSEACVTSPDVLAVDDHAPARQLVEAEQDARDGGFAGAGRSDDGDHFSRRNREAHLLQDRALRIVGEGHVLEVDLAFLHPQLLGARLVDDLRRFVQQREHGLDVDQALLDLAIDHAHEIERQVELYEDGVDHDEVADGERAACHVARRQQHADHRADGEDQRLAGIEQAERAVGADGRPLVARHGGIETARLEVLVAEILHRLVVEQAVDGLGMRFRVGFVHVAPDDDAALAGPEGKPYIEGDGDEDHDDIDPAEIEGHQSCDHQELDRGRDRIQHRHAHDGVDAADAALDDAVQASGAALEVEPQGELVQMPEGAVGELADRILGHHGEQHVAELGEQHHQHAPDAISDDEHGGDGGKSEGGEPGHGAGGRLSGENVDDRLIGDGNGEGDGLGDDERRQRQDHAHAKIRPIGRPDIGDQLAQDAPMSRPCLKHGVASRLRKPVLHEESVSISAPAARQKRAAIGRCPCSTDYIGSPRSPAKRVIPEAP